ncbi:MAG: hypothetical protein ABL949_01960 [Fimbriimonadaceae bacterium]
MFTPLVALALLTVPQEPETVVFNQKQTSLLFSYPKAWKATTNKLNTKFEFPISDSDQTATVEIWPAEFSGTKEVWETTQSTIVTQLKQTLVKQWQEEILTVPMLITRSTNLTDEVAYTTDSAMIYGPSFWKFLYRLKARSDVFDRADYQWRLVLQSLRPEAGGSLTPFDPNRKPLNSEKSRRGGSTTILSPTSNAKPAKIVLGEGTQTVTAGGKELILRFPKDWTVKSSSEGESSWVFSRPGVQPGIVVTVQSIVDSPNASRAFARKGALSLDLFSKVVARTESLPTPSKSGMQVAHLFRSGEAAQQPFLATLDSVGSLGDYYWLAHWRVTDKSELKHLESIKDLLQILRIEATK